MEREKDLQLSMQEDSVFLKEGSQPLLEAYDPLHEEDDIQMRRRRPGAGATGTSWSSDLYYVSDSSSGSTSYLRNLLDSTTG
jgi:hypothetical protein